MNPPSYSESPELSDRRNVVAFAYSSPPRHGQGSGSTRAAQEPESMAEHTLTFREHLVQSQDFFDSHQHELKIAEIGDRYVIKGPTASKLSYQLLHPTPIRGLQGIRDLQHLAELVGAPENWREVLQTAKSSLEWQGRVHRAFNKMKRDESVESLVESRHHILIYEVGKSLRFDVDEGTPRKIGVGGLLVQDKYDYLSSPDKYFIREDSKRPVLVTEAKTFQTFEQDHLWYLDARSPQILACMYAFNAPALFYTSKCCKFFVENEERDTIFTYPVDTPNVPANDEKDQFKRSLLVKRFDPLPSENVPIDVTQVSDEDEKFLDMLAVCLMGRGGQIPDFLDELSQAESASSSKRSTPRGSRSSLESRQASAETLTAPVSSRPLRRSARFRIGTKPDGTPEYREVVVYDAKFVEQFWKENGLPESDEESDWEEEEEIHEKPSTSTVEESSASTLLPSRGENV